MEQDTSIKQLTSDFKMSEVNNQSESAKLKAKMLGGCYDDSSNTLSSAANSALKSLIVEAIVSKITRHDSTPFLPS
jgi:hypothetical protein